MRDIVASRARSLLVVPDTTEVFRRSSLWLGAPGIHYVRILATRADRDRVNVQRAVRAFVEQVACVPDTEGPTDLILGAAGNLIAVTLLTAVLRSTAALDQMGERLAARVTSSIWSDDADWSDWSFAHGWPGMAFALLQRSQVTGGAVSDQLLTRLCSLASRPAPGSAGPDPVRAASWCNGAAGRILLWVKAYELTGDRGFLQRARADAELIPQNFDRANHLLCCGTPGWGYAFLALERVSRGEGWYRRALRLCVDIVESNPRFEHASGLLKGYSGVLSLATDVLLHTPSCGFPFVEALPVAPGPSGA